MHNVITLKPEFTDQQESLNCVTHAIGILFAVSGIPFLLLYAIRSNNTNNCIAAGIYGSSLLMTFLFSTLFHSAKNLRRRHLFRILDHISIYLLIAGTYTPLIINYMPSAEGAKLLAVTWSFALVGIIFKIFFVEKVRKFSVYFYLFIGLIFIFDSKNFFALMPYDVAFFTLAGIVIYLIGVIVYILKRGNYHHAVWHLLTLIASICHFYAIFLTVK